MSRMAEIDMEQGDERQQQGAEESELHHHEQELLKMTTAKPDGLALLRKPFPEHQISKLPKPTAKQTDEVKANFRAGIRCGICGSWHHPDVIHLDYVGHAALTDRLLDCDPNWNWEPLAIGPDGNPVVDKDGGMWIRLTVCGVTRLGYGDAQGKTGGNATKERIGDALRNAAMRFGAALDLWHKGDLHIEEEAPPDIDAIIASISNAPDLEILKAHFSSAISILDKQYHAKIIAAKDDRKSELELRSLDNK